MNREKIQNIKEIYTPGTRVKLLRMRRNIHALSPGTHGTVRFVDDIGDIHVAWDTGSSSTLLIDEDDFIIEAYLNRF